MTYDIYSTSALMGAYGVDDLPRAFLRDVFFRGNYLADTQTVAFDKGARSKRIASYVSSHATGPVQKLRSYTSTLLTAPYVKLRSAFTPDKMFNRSVGEQIAGNLSPQERFLALVQDEMRVHDDQITRLEEVQAAQVLFTGMATLAGDEFPTQTINYSRPASNTVQLTGSNTWGSANVHPLRDLQQWSTIVQTVSGYVPRIVIMDPYAYDLFINSADVALVMNTFRQTQGDINLAGYAVGGIGNQAQLMGNIGGFEVWVYQNFFWDENGNDVLIMPQNTVILGDPMGCQGTKIYGAIQDMEAGMTKARRFPKMWTEPNPSAVILQTQSAPLMALGWAEATFAATVA